MRLIFTVAARAGTPAQRTVKRALSANALRERRNIRRSGVSGVNKYHHRSETAAASSGCASGVSGVVTKTGGIRHGNIGICRRNEEGWA